MKLGSRSTCAATDLPLTGVPEGMWRIDHRRQGSGIATEAMQAAAAWFDATQVSARTVYMIDLTNMASRHLAEHLGFP